MNRLVVTLFSVFFLTAVACAPSVLVSKTFAQGNTNAPQSVGQAACNAVDPKQFSTCTGCFDGGGVWTAIGCWKADSPSDFVTWFVKLGTGIGGGIAMLLILFSGFQRITSAGNPERLHEAKELMTAAISGLLLIIFSIFLLRLIGVDILQIPGLG